jgi:hypothetical protein
MIELLRTKSQTLTFWEAKKMKSEEVIVALNNLREAFLELFQEAILNKFRSAVAVFEEVSEIQKEIENRLAARKGWEHNLIQPLMCQVIIHKPVRAVARSCC